MEEEQRNHDYLQRVGERKPNQTEQKRKERDLAEGKTTKWT